MKLLLSILLPFYMISNYANEVSSYDEQFYSISEVTVNEVAPTSDILSSNEYSNKSVGSVVMTTKSLLALGKEIWAIIEKGRPVVNVASMQPISVLPRSEGQNVDAFDLDNWRAPKVKSYRVEFKNGFNMVVIGFTYNVVFQYGGSLDGKGKYLTGVNVSASDVDVSWGFNFNANSKLINISNTGSKENPVASAIIEISYRAKSVVKDISAKRSFYITGNGTVKNLY